MSTMLIGVLVVWRKRREPVAKDALADGIEQWRSVRTFGQR